MARQEKHCALTLVNDTDDVDSAAPSSGGFTVLPPALPADELDLIGPTSDLLSLAALEAALDALPFGDDADDVLVFLDAEGPKGDPANDGVPEGERPTRRYTIPDVPPCMRATARPQA